MLIATEQMMPLPQELRDVIAWWRRLMDFEAKYPLVRHLGDAGEGCAWTRTPHFYHSW